jgi:cytochrome c5
MVAVSCDAVGAGRVFGKSNIGDDTQWNQRLNQGFVTGIETSR